MIARLPFTVRIGCALILIGIVVFGSWACWAASRTWVPLEVPISLSQGHIRTAQFKINLEGTYSVAIIVEGKFDSDGVSCLLGCFKCEGTPSVLGLSWSLSDGERVVGHGDSDVDYGWFWGTTTVGRTLGYFRARKGHYLLDLDVLQDGSRLNAGAPHLVVFETGEHGIASGPGAIAALVSLLFAVAGTFLIIRSAIERRREKLEVLARACSLTQPGPQPGEPQMGSRPVAPYVHSATAAGHLWWKPRPSDRRPFSGLSSFGLFAAIAYLLVLIPLWVLQSWDQPIPQGLTIHLLPGILAQSSSGIQPLRVWVESGEPRVSPILYVDWQLVAWENFETVLKKELSRRPPNWPVYLEGDANMEWGNAVKAMDAIRGLGAEVVLLTAGTASPPGRSGSRTTSNPADALQHGRR
jgi:hypothetical protein